MQRQKATFICGILLLSFSIMYINIFDASGQSSNGIIVSNADAVSTLSQSQSTSLFDSIGRVLPSAYVEDADFFNQFSLPVISSILSAKLDNVGHRALVNFSDHNNIFPLSLKSDLSSSLAMVTTKPSTASMDHGAVYSMTFPATFLQDSSVPVVVSEATFIKNQDGEIFLEWETDEFTRSEIRIGTETGNYTQTIQQPLYEKAHSISLSQISAEQTYYCTITSLDLSGNRVESVEYRLRLSRAPSDVFLPYIDR